MILSVPTQLSAVMENITSGNFSLLSLATTPDIIHLGRHYVEDPTVKLLRYVSEVWLTLPLILLGILGNVVSFVVLCHHRRQKLQTTTTLLQVLAVADTLVLVTVLLLRTLRYLIPTNGYTIFHAHIYVGLFPALYVLRLVNTWLTVLVTVDRYIATCRPLHAQRLCTMKRTYILITAVIVGSMVFCLPRFFENKTHFYDPRRLVENPYYVIIYQVVLFLLVQYLIPMILLVVLNGFVVRALRRSTVYRASVALRPMPTRPTCARIPPTNSYSRSSTSESNQHSTDCGGRGVVVGCSNGLPCGGAGKSTLKSTGYDSTGGAGKSTFKSTGYDSTFESTRRVTIIVVVVVLLCTVCHTVAMVAQVLWSIQKGGFDLGGSSSTVDLFRRHWSQASNVLVTLNSASNFVIYCMCSRNFRLVLVRRVLCCFRCLVRRRRVPTQPEVVLGRGAQHQDVGAAMDEKNKNIALVAAMLYDAVPGVEGDDGSFPVNRGHVTKMITRRSAIDKLCVLFGARRKEKENSAKDDALKKAFIGDGNQTKETTAEYD